MKGVSARVDENAGVGKKDGPGLAETTAKVGKKRPRTVSFGNVTEPKRGRLKENILINGDKGKGRASYQNRDGSEESQSLQGHHSMSNVYLLQDASQESAEYRGIGVLTDANDLEGPLPTLSQTKMPPPPAPLRPPLCFKRNSAHLSYCSTDKQTAVEKNLGHTKPDPIPKLHPLLLSKSPGSSSPYSDSRSNPKPSVGPWEHQSKANSGFHANGQHVVPTTVNPAPLATNPAIAVKSSRPPVLGMRRTHTYPCRSFNNKSLPVKQKGFKPPLMSSSQPQSLSQQSQGTGLNINPEPAANPTAFRKQSGNKMGLLASQAPTCSNSPTDSFHLTPPSCTSSTSLFDSPVPLRQHAADVREVAIAPRSAAGFLTDFVNGDSDSSFGDTSFDLDALEETMRMYD